MSQTPYSEEPISPIGRIDIGPGGIISDGRENRELLETIENAPVLSPIELHALAVSYQQFMPVLPRPDPPCAQQVSLARQCEMFRQRLPS